MPNFPQHPVALFGGIALSKNAALYSDLLIASGDTLVVPPPPEGAYRLITQQTLQTFLAVVGTGTADASLVYKDGDGNEVVLDTAAAIPTTGAAVDGGILLTSDDQGVFVRVTTDPTTGAVSAYFQWTDVRNILRADTELTDTFQDILPQPADETSVYLAGLLEEAEGSMINVLNVDTVNARTVEFQLTDGTVTLPIPGASALAGVRTAFINYLAALPPGMRLQARATVAPTSPLIASVAYSLTNLGPTKDYQGGAY